MAAGSATAMQSLSTESRNKVLIICLGVATISILKWGVSFLKSYEQDYDDSIEAQKKKNKRSQYITQETEDSVKVSTLETLLKSPNHGIADVASRIVLDRSLYSPQVFEDVLYEVTRPDHDRREAAIRVLQHLANSTYPIKQFNNTKVYIAIVKALEYCLTDIPHDPYDRDHDMFDFRDACERRALALVWRISSEFTMAGFIKAGIVSKWLAKQPFGTTLKESQDNFIHLYNDNGVIPTIVHRIGYSTQGRKELLKAKLISNTTTLFNDMIDVRMINGESTAGEIVVQAIHDAVAMSNDGELRSRELSPEEINMRRRHRQAMVLNDGSQPIGSDDIIERDLES